jgi:hypothetical protein
VGRLSTNKEFPEVINREIIGVTAPSELNPATITQDRMSVVANFKLEADVSLGTDVIIGVYTTRGGSFDIKEKVAARIVEHGLQPPPGVKNPLYAGYRDLKPLTENWIKNIKSIIPELFQTCVLDLIGIIDDKNQSLRPVISPIPYGCPIFLPTSQEMKIIYAFREGWTIGAIVQGMKIIRLKEDSVEKVFPYPLDPYAIFRGVYIVGGPGSGKTVLAKTLIEHAYESGWVIIAPDFKDEFAQMLFKAEPDKHGFTEDDKKFWEEIGFSPMGISELYIYYLRDYPPNFTYLKEEGYDIEALKKHMKPFTIEWSSIPAELAALYMPNPSEQAVDFFPQVIDAFREYAKNMKMKATLKNMMEWSLSYNGRETMSKLGLYSSTIQSIQRNLIAMDRSKIFDEEGASDFVEEEIMKPPRLNVISVSQVPFEFRMIFQLHWLLKSLEVKKKKPGEPYLMQILDEAHYIVPRSPSPGYQQLLVSKVIETIRVFRAACAGLVLISHSPEDFHPIVNDLIGTKIFGNLEEAAIKSQARDLQEFSSRISQLPPGYFVIRSPPNITNIAAPKCHLIKCPRCRTTHIESEVLYRKALTGKT